MLYPPHQRTPATNDQQPTKMPRPLPRLRHVLALPIPNLQRTQFPRLRPAPFSQRFATTTNTTTTTASPAASSFLPATPDNSFQKTAKAQRKARKDAHEEKDQGKSGGDGVLWNGISGHAGRWEVVCGLEIHAQLNTGRKLFSGLVTFFFSKSWLLMEKF